MLRCVYTVNATRQEMRILAKLHAGVGLRIRFHHEKFHKDDRSSGNVFLGKLTRCFVRCHSNCKL